MDDDFSTIEHDFLHTKDYFSNYKFIYKERKSKLDFFQNIHNASVQDTTGLLEAAKQQLVEVKRSYYELDDEIKALGQEIYACDAQLAERNRELAALEAEENTLKTECEGLRALDERLRINDDLNEELDSIEAEIKGCYSKIDQARAALDSSLLRNKQEEEAELRASRQELAARQKRLTIVNTDSYIEDMYCWYEQMEALLRSVLGHVDVQMVDGRCVVRVQRGQAQAEAVLRDRKLLEASLGGLPEEKMVRRFNECKEYCIKSNNLVLLVAKLFLL